MNIELVRQAYLPDATLGWLVVEELKLATIERPWLENPEGPGGKLRESCVPDGLYTLRPHDSKSYPNTYALINEALGVYYQQRPAGQAWGRTAILIHQGNWVRNVIGCIAVGLNHGEMSSEPAVINSLHAMNKLREALGRKWHTLLIRPTTGTLEKAA